MEKSTGDSKGYNQILDIVKALDDRIKIEAQGIYDRICGGVFNSDLFPTMIPFEILEMTARPNELRGKKGIYVFMMKADYSVSDKQTRMWCRVEGAGFKQLCGVIELHKGDCLYVGSCVSESLYTRIGQHVNSKGECTALKLSHPNRDFLKPYVIGYAFPLDKCIKEQYYQYIIPQIEKRLHAIFEPVAGSKRV